MVAITSYTEIDEGLREDTALVAFFVRSHRAGKKLVLIKKNEKFVNENMMVDYTWYVRLNRNPMLFQK